MVKESKTHAKSNNKLNDYLFYFLYTLNPYPNWIEGGLPPLEDRINTFKELSKHCPVIWRYDPMYDIPLGEVYERKTELEFEII